MKIISLLFVFLIALTSYADLKGDWIGWGTWKFKGEGDGVQCSPMQMTWSESATEIAIEKGNFECEVVAMILGRTAWTLKDGKLFDELNVEVGKYNGKDHFEVYMPSPNNRTQIYLSVRRAANHIDYQEIWFNTDEKVYVIEGRLFTSGNK
ncbi:MAG: hypothetical protein A2622_01840 [Bdellovibrionales bacterium RIFCSPHIGHO2_01_FULL_40_29]|nr:MAG: hypothetical protein A2622_01840 [Bdellovibrionales bacterium RIFCSPHIGHO2_01_FULL_40_29]OFZ33833.1 MAG: hypothetical protein A3D17_02260 [Bdellovibrionales bacterium RIFCSPHIGHO2_02_FULL_40_15]